MCGKFDFEKDENIKKAASFLKKHNFMPEFKNSVERILYDMNLGLFGGKEKAGQDMLRTWILPGEKQDSENSVIVIDAGGTNFRSCLVHFNDGKIEITDLKKTKMPGVEKELTKKEFFSKIAENIEYLKDKSSKISFCFSYAMEMTKDGDGIPNAFSKEVKAPEVLGVKVGETLLSELKERGWKKIERIRLLNDSAAALIAGAYLSQKKGKNSTFIGFILGTGMNAAYIQPAKDGIEKQIIVCESGKCDKIALSDIDVSLDRKTAVPSLYPLEKCCSGGYLGMVGFELIKFAADENLFSEETKEKLSSLEKLDLIEMDRFLHGFEAKSSDSECGILSSLVKNEDDRKILFYLLDSAVERSAVYASATVSAALLQCEGGKSPENPVCIFCNGTTFFKTYRLKERFEKYLSSFAQEKNIFYAIESFENDITIGTALAGSL